VQSTPRDPAASTLVERDAARAQLESLVDAAVGGRHGAARVLGAAGLGKTALVRWLETYATERGARVWLTSAGQLESRIPFGVVRRLLDRPVRALGQESRSRLEQGPARLALTHLWSGSLAGPGEAPGPGDMTHSLGWLLEELVETGPPVVVVVDDAQWADEESLLFLAHLRERLAGLAAAVVVAARDEADASSPALATLIADRDATVLRLEPLTPRGVDSVLSETWGRVPVDAAAAVSEVTGGNPFLLHALADALADVSDSLDGAHVRSFVPESVVDLMLARLSALPADEQALAHAVAVLDSGSLATAAALAGIDRVTAAGAADRLRRAGLLAGEGVLRFRHALLRSAVYATLGPDTRDRLHRDAAHLLATAAAPDRAGAAAHLLSASGVGDPWAVELLRSAASEAVALGAPQSAVPLLERAVDEPAGEGELPQLTFELGQAQLRTFDPACTGTLARSYALATEPRDRAARALVLASAYGFAGRHADAADVLTEAGAAIDGLDRELELTLFAAWAGVALLLPDRVGEATRRLAELGDLDGATAGERLVVIQQLYVAASTNRPASVIRALAARVIGDWDSAEQHPETGDWVWPRLFVGRIGDYELVRRLTDTGLDHAEAIGSVVGMIAANFVRAFTEFDAGSFAVAEQHYRAMLEHHDGGLLIQLLGHSGLAQTLSRQGRHREAREVLAQFPELLAPETPSSGAALIWHARALVAHSEGDHQAALAATEQLGALLSDLGADSPTWISWRPLAIDPLRSLGRIDEARALAAEHLALCERSEVPHLIGEALCLLGTVAADAAEGIGLAQRGVALVAGTGSRFRIGMCSLMLGSMLRRSGRKGEAREHLRAAIEVLSECGADPAVDFAADELAATGIRLVRADPRRLTPSEHRVAELAVLGHSNREIALRLHVTRKTVETHLSAVYRKLDLSRREEILPEHL
jgi:DNA-binding CsgD family transcriptional regulator